MKIKIEYLIFAFLAVVIGISLFSLIDTFTEDAIKESHSEKKVSLTSFDKEIAKELMDKDNDGKCDSCGMDIKSCIDTGQLQCNMDKSSTIGVLGSDHIHAHLEIDINGEKISLNNEKYFVKSAFVHVEDGEGAGEMLHIHAKGIPIWLFFKSIGIEFNSSSFIFEGNEYSNNENKKLRFFVNEKENDQFGDYVPKDMDKILILYGNE